MSEKQPNAGEPATVAGGYHSHGVPGEEGAVRPRMRVRTNDPSRRVGRGRPLMGGSGADATSADKEATGGRFGVAAGPSGSLFVITAHASNWLNTPVFQAGDGDGEEAVAVFTTADAAHQYIDRAGWGQADEVGVLRPADQQEWFQSAFDDGVRWVVIDPDRDRHLAGDPQAVVAIEGELAALAGSLARG